MPIKDVKTIVRICNEMLTRSNTSQHENPVLFRACLCSHGWLAACSPISSSHQRMVHSGGSSAGGAGEHPLVGGPLVPLSAVLVLLCVGVVVLVLAYRQQARRRRSGGGSDVDPGDSEATEAAVRTCRAPPPAIPSVPLRCSLPSGMRAHHHRTYDPPPAYLSVIAEEPPSYEIACSDDQLDKLGRTGLTEAVS